MVMIRKVFRVKMMDYHAAAKLFNKAAAAVPAKSDSFSNKGWQKKSYRGKKYDGRANVVFIYIYFSSLQRLNGSTTYKRHLHNASSLIASLSSFLFFLLSDIKRDATLPFFDGPPHDDAKSARRASPTNPRA